MKEQLLELFFRRGVRSAQRCLTWRREGGFSATTARSSCLMCEGDLSTLRRRDGNGRILRFLPEGVCI